ncbi:MAG: thiamine-phosphate kinase [Deltaproteobacteria bacterium]|nr:thiamine-phosphate kinase [Deltaproteobacteria bacterium]
MQIKELGELGLIKKLAKEFSSNHPRVIKGIGDDCAVTVQDEAKYLLSTTDTLVEDIHFSLKYTPPYNLGKKAVSISLSDIAAMGGTPMFLLTSIILPAATSTDFINFLYKGIKEKADESGAALIGGNTSSSPGKIIISTTMLGEVPKDQLLLRKGASAGDMIYVTGLLGDSSLGLKIWKQKGNTPITDPFLKDAMLAHIDPAPRVREGRTIAEKKLATAMIDISDGLISDLRHVAEESGVGARVWLKKIPISIGLKRWVVDHPQDIAFALSGGEDYELLFTVSKENSRRIDAVSRELNIPITYIGEIVSKEEGLAVLDEKNEPFPLTAEGFEHFKNIG